MAYIDTDYYSSREDITLDSINFPTELLVEEWIDECSEDIDKELQRTFVLGDYVDTIKETENRQGTQIVFAKNTPVNSLTSVTADQNRNAFDKNLQIVTSVLLDSDTGMIKLQKPISQQEVLISYNGGYASDSYPAKVKELCYLMVKRKQTDIEIRQEAGDDTTTSISSITVRERNPSSLTNKLSRLDAQIQDLITELGKDLYIGTY